MYLGVSSSLAHTTPQDWAEKHKSLGLKSVVFPVDCTAGEETISAYKKAVDRPQFGAHLDAVNMITSPDRYFFNDNFLDECFEKLGNQICSCHLKDIRLKEEYTFQLQECACGQGSLDIKRYINLATSVRPDMPMIIEHLTTDEEYISSVEYIQNLLSS